MAPPPSLIGRTGLKPVGHYTPTPTRAAKGKAQVQAPSTTTGASRDTASTSPFIGEKGAATAASPLSIPSASATGSAMSMQGKTKGKGKAKAKAADEDKEEGEISDGDFAPSATPARPAAGTAAKLSTSQAIAKANVTANANANIGVSGLSRQPDQAMAASTPSKTHQPAHKPTLDTSQSRSGPQKSASASGKLAQPVVSSYRPSTSSTAPNKVNGQAGFSRASNIAAAGPSRQDRQGAPPPSLPPLPAAALASSSASLPVKPTTMSAPAKLPAQATSAAPIAIDKYDRENKYEYQFAHGVSPNPTPKKGKKKKNKGRAQEQGQQTQNAAHVQQSMAGGSGSTSSIGAGSVVSTIGINGESARAVPVVSTSTNARPREPTTSTPRASLPNASGASQSTSASTPKPTSIQHFSPAAPSSSLKRVVKVDITPASDVPTAPKDSTPASLHKYIKELRRLLRSGHTDEMLLARGVPAKYLTLVFQQIKQESDGRQKKDKPVEDGPKAASSASGTAHVGKRARRAQVEEGLAPATAPGQGSAASAHVSASPRDGGMDIDMEDHGDIDEDGNAAIEGATQGAAEAGADAGADVNVRVQMTLNSGTGMTRSVSGNTDSSEERQVERMMALLSPEASADVPLVPITEPVAPLPVAASGTSQSLPPTPNASQRQPPKPQQLHQPLRLAASSSWTPTPPPAGPRALQTRLQSQQPPVSRAVPIEPPPIGTSTQRGEAGSANTPNSASMSRAALLKAKLLASRAAQAASPVYAPLASTVAPITQSAPDSSSATAPLNPLARPFASAPSRAIPIVAPGLASTPASIAGSAVAPIFVSSSASDPDSEPKTSKVTAKPLAPVRDLTATLQARTAALEARRKAMESMRAKRQQVKAELSVDNAVLEGANQEEASTSTSLSSTSNSLSQTDPSGSHTLEQADAMTSAPGEDGKMELDDDNELADLKADLDSMVKEAAEKEAQVEAQEQAQAETAAQVSAEGSGNETPVQSVSEEVVDMEPEEGEISEGSPPPPTRSFTPGSSLPPTAASNTGPTVLNKRKRPTALDFDYPSSGTASPHLGPGSNLHPSKKRFGGIGFSYSTRPHAALPYAERVAIEREKVRLTYELPAEEDDSSDEDEQDERAQVKRWKQAAEDSPVPEIRIPDEYDPKKQLRDHTLRMREVEERIRLAQAKIDARKRKAKAGGDVKGMSAAMLDEADASGTPSAQMSRAVSDVSVAAVEDGAKGGVDESGMDLDVPQVINDEDEPKAVKQIEAPAYKPILPLYPRLTRHKQPSSQTASAAGQSIAEGNVNIGLLNDIILTRRLSADPDSIVCAAEMGGGACADAGCGDLHLGRQVSITEADLVQYASHQYPKHSAKVVRAAVHSIVKSTRGKRSNASVSRLGTATAAAASPTASGSAPSANDALERDDLLQALAQVVALLGSLPPASSSSTSSSSLAGAA